MNMCYIFPRQTERLRHISSDHLVERRLGTSCFALREGLFPNRISVLKASLPLYREVGWRSLKGTYSKKYYCLCCTYKVANRIKDRLICYEMTMITYILFPKVDSWGKYPLSASGQIQRDFLFDQTNRNLWNEMWKKKRNRHQHQLISLRWKRMDNRFTVQHIRHRHVKHKRGA